MRAALIVLAAVGCSSERRPAGPSWWCWEEGLCFPTRELCRDRAGRIGTDSACVARPVAHCRHGCDEYDGTFSCTENCVGEAEVCEAMVKRRYEEPCVAKPPPATPMLYPSYTKPGWWCWEAARPDGAHVSSCAKYERACEAWRTEGIAGGLAPGPCVARGRDVSCYQLDLAARNEIDFHCYLNAADCEAARPGAAARGRLVGGTGFGPCAPWAYD